MNSHENSLRDRIYEASVIPELWPAVCDSVSEAVDAHSMTVISMSPRQTIQTVSSACVEDLWNTYRQSGMTNQNERFKRASESATPSDFCRDIDLMSEAELEVDPIYTTFLYPNGLGWTMGALFEEPSGSTLVFDLLRHRDRGAFTPAHVDWLNHLKGDLARAAFMTTRLAFREAIAVTQALSAIGLPAAVLGEAGEAIAMNAEFEDLAPQVRTGFGNRVSFRHPQANTLFQSTLQRLKQNGRPEVQSLPIAAGEGEPSLVVQLVPVRRNARDIFSKASTIVVVTKVGEAGPPDLHVISGLFDLTGAEARVAQQIAMGRSLVETADALGVTYQTIRTHLKATFRKTGTSRQSELVSILSGLAKRL